MIKPTEADIGRKVVYRDPSRNEPETGVVSSLAKAGGQIDPRFVFVRFRGATGELTPTDRLEFAPTADEMISGGVEFVPFKGKVNG